jgi:hypothetical protein
MAESSSPSKKRKTSVDSPVPSSQELTQPLTPEQTSEEKETIKSFHYAPGELDEV